MTKLLVSTITQGLLTVDTETLNMQQYYPELNAMGICKYEDGYIVSERYGDIYFLDSNLEITRIIYSEIDRNLHDLVVLNDNLYVVDSLTNTILVYNINSGEIIDNICLFQNTTEDIHHINSLEYYNGKFYLSMFMFDTGKLAVKHTLSEDITHELDTPVIGFSPYPFDLGAIIVFNPITFTIENVINKNLWCPHSIYFINDTIHYVESRNFKLYNNTQEVMQSTSFLRGIISDSEYIYIGKSADRYNPDRNASIIILDMTYNLIDEIKIDIFNNSEIYDIKVID